MSFRVTMIGCLHWRLLEVRLMVLFIRQRRTLRLPTLFTVPAVGLVAPMLAAPGYAASPGHGSGGRVQDAGDQAGELMTSLDQLSQARTAPTGLVAPGAYAAASAQLNKLPT